MALGACQLAECTFNITGQCVQEYPVEECPNREGSDSEISEEINGESAGAEPSQNSTESPTSTRIGAPVLESPAENPRLPPSGTMGIAEANELMSSRYVTMVGILGLPESGKTACLVSAYLLLARGQFTGFSYADSRTLMAFEEIARGSRRWAVGEIPGQMTVHTELADDRVPGFLHLRIKRETDGCVFDMLLPDLPGEWSKDLIDKDDAQRLDFLKSATVLWIMVDGRQFGAAKTRGYAGYRAELLIERLAGILPSPRPRLLLVPSWRDSGEFPAASYNAIREEGIKWGIDIELAPVASFSNNEQVEPGEGVVKLIEQTITHNRAAGEFWPTGTTKASARSLLSFGCNQ